MSASHVQQNGHVGRCYAAQMCDVSFFVCGHLKNKDLLSTVLVQYRKGKAILRVHVAGGFENVSSSLQKFVKYFLRCCFSVRARYSNYRFRRVVQFQAGKFCQRFHRVFDKNNSVRVYYCSLCYDSMSSALQSLIYEIMTVESFSFHSNENVSFLYLF